MTDKTGCPLGPISFAEHVIFGRQLDAALKTLEMMRRATVSGGMRSRQLRDSIGKAENAINMVRNDAENLLCSTVPASEHTKNPCSVYYGPFDAE